MGSLSLAAVTVVGRSTGLPLCAILWRRLGHRLRITRLYLAYHEN